MRTRKARSDRILRMLASTNPPGTTELRKTPYGLLTPASLAMAVSKPTASRDFELVRRIQRQFLRMFGRNFDRRRDQVVWAWDWAHYGFITPENEAAGYRKPVGHFPFDTRKQETEESYGGFSPVSWPTERDYISQMSPRELMRAYGRVVRMRDRHRRTNVERMQREVKQALEHWLGSRMH